MRWWCTALLLASCADERPVECRLPEGLPVFPGAEGFGTHTRAGRGGRVMEVTSLADSGPGTLREAASAREPRIVVFRVGGTITLKSHLEVFEPFLTIAGQTAPGDGVLVNGAGIVLFTHDVLIQHLRFRPGAMNAEPEVNDAIQAFGPGSGVLPGAFNIVIDHVSASWGEDEVVSTLWGVRDFTVSWSIIAEGLNRARHEKGTHSSGLLLAGGCNSVHHTLFAHNDFRNPLVMNGGRHDLVNNVVYDWGVLATEVVALTSPTEVNLVGNVYLPGPSRASEIREVVVSQGHPVHHFIKPEALFSPAARPSLFAQDNLGPNRAAGDEWTLVTQGYGAEALDPSQRGPRHPAPPVSTDSASDSVERTLEGAGATLPRRDPVDARIVREVRERGGRIIDSIEQVGGFPVMAGGTPPPDGDHDGMPDAWETARGLDPADGADGSRDADSDGYTNVEEYLHSI